MGLDASFYAIKEIILDLLKFYLDLRRAVLKILAMCKYKIYVREYFEYIVACICLTAKKYSNVITDFTSKL